MQTKLSQVQAAYLSGNFRKALQIAAKFPDLGSHRAAITRAHECFTNPRFYMQLGYDIDQSIAAGVKALADRYSF